MDFDLSNSRNQIFGRTSFERGNTIILLNEDYFHAVVSMSLIHGLFFKVTAEHVVQQLELNLFFFQYDSYANERPDTTRDLPRCADIDMLSFA